MGTCHNCNTEVTLKDDQTKCDSCGEIVFYNCNNCSEKFEVENKETRRKLKKRLNNKDTCQLYRGEFIKKKS